MPGTVGSASRFRQRRAVGFVDSAQFLRTGCTFCPLGLTGSAPLHLVHVCSGHSKLLASASRIAQIGSIVSGQFFLLCPFWSRRVFVHAFVLKAVVAPCVSVVRPAACFASWFGTIGLDGATSLAMLALFVARAVVVLMRFVAARVAHADSFGWTLRAEWPVAPHVLHPRYGHEPISLAIVDCAHSVP